jgi:hypothetical protein
MKYLELSDNHQPLEINSTLEAHEVNSKAFSAKQIGECEFLFKFTYNVPTTRVKLSLLQIDDLINFYKIYCDQNPNWHDKSVRLVKAVDMEKV